MLHKFCKCGELIDLGQQKCPRCMKADNEKYKQKKVNRKDYDINKFYSTKKWIEIRNKVRQRDRKLCLFCLDESKIEVANVVHHIVPMKENESLAYDMNNLICLCNKHHNLVHELYDEPIERTQTQELLRILIKEYKV